jgi:two-component system, chemotaxis family, chemotaxis protein CheY
MMGGTGPDCRVLVVDDEPAIRYVVAETLAFEGYPVKTAENGAEALRIVEKEHPELVLLDMRMPVLDGWGFAKKLKQRGLDVPIVVMTAAHNGSGWSREIGAKAYLPKPFDLIDLLDTVERLCPPPVP